MEADTWPDGALAVSACGERLDKFEELLLELPDDDVNPFAWLKILFVLESASELLATFVLTGGAANAVSCGEESVELLVLFSGVISISISSMYCLVKGLIDVG